MNLFQLVNVQSTQDCSFKGQFKRRFYNTIQTELCALIMTFIKIDWIKTNKVKKKNAI